MKAKTTTRFVNFAMYDGRSIAIDMLSVEAVTQEGSRVEIHMKSRKAFLVDEETLESVVERIAQVRKEHG